jgi:hypothetical protein
MRSPLDKYHRRASTRYGNKGGDSEDPGRCQATITINNGRAPSTFAQCRNKRKPGTIRPAVNRWAPHDDPTKDDMVEIEVCGKHASVYDRAVAKSEEHRRDRQESEENNKRAQDVVQVLASLGVKADSYYQTGYGSDLGRYINES